MARVSKSLRVTLQKFFEQTTINGFTYVADPANHIIVKVGWFILIIVFMVLASYLVVLSFDDWSNNPTVTTIDSATFPIEELPFPSVTVCQEDQGIRSSEKWALPAEILNYASWFCNEFSHPSCKQNETISSNPTLQRVIYGVMKGLMRMSLQNNILEIRYPSEEGDSWETVRDRAGLNSHLNNKWLSFIQAYVDHQLSSNGTDIVDQLFDIFKTVRMQEADKVPELVSFMKSINGYDLYFIVRE